MDCESKEPKEPTVGTSRCEEAEKITSIFRAKKWRMAGRGWEGEGGLRCSGLSTNVNPTIRTRARIHTMGDSEWVESSIRLKGGIIEDRAALDSVFISFYLSSFFLFLLGRDSFAVKKRQPGCDSSPCSALSASAGHASTRAFGCGYKIKKTNKKMNETRRTSGERKNTMLRSEEAGPNSEPKLMHGRRSRSGLMRDADRE